MTRARMATIQAMSPTRTVGTAIAALALATGLAHAPAPASAAAKDGGGAYAGAAAQALTWPLPLGTTVVIEGPANTWQLRGFAESVDAALPGVDVVSGSAADHPGAFVVTVEKEHRRSGAFAGFTRWRPIPPGASYPDGATITLNTLYRDTPRSTRRQVAAHEFMHVLGFRHHGGEGVAGAQPPLTLDPAPSAEEWAALHAYYG